MVTLDVIPIYSNRCLEAMQEGAQRFLDSLLSFVSWMMDVVAGSKLVHSARLAHGVVFCLGFGRALVSL